MVWAKAIQIMTCRFLCLAAALWSLTLLRSQGADSPANPSDAAFQQELVKQQQIKTTTKRVGDQLEGVIAEFDRNGISGEDVKVLRAIRGVRSVVDRGRLGIHQCFDIDCDEDLREDVGALAAQRGWALRELSWSRPTLETLFARIALDLEQDVPGATASARIHAAPPAASSGLIALDIAASKPVPARTLDANRPLPLGTPTPARAAYNLNPFEGAVARDLSKPKPVPPAQDERCGETPLDRRTDAPGKP